MHFLVLLFLLNGGLSIASLLYLPSTNLSNPLTSIANLTGPYPPQNFAVEYSARSEPIDKDAFYALTINTLVNLAEKDFDGDIIGSETYHSPQGYQDIKVEITAIFRQSGKLSRRLAVWGLVETIRYMAGKDTFTAANVDLFWDGWRQGVIFVSQPLYDGRNNSSVAAPYNTSQNLSTEKQNLTRPVHLGVDEISISAHINSKSINKDAALLTLVSALASAAPNSPDAVTHGISNRFAPWPAYFSLSDHGWPGHEQIPTKPPFLTWGIVIKVVMAAFDEYQTLDDYKEMEILIWTEEVELATGGVLPWPEPVLLGSEERR